MNKLYLISFSMVLMLLTLDKPAWSRPVSYPDGWTVMTMNNGDRNSLHVHYSPTVNYSLGYRAEYWRDKDFAINALQANALLKRWNEKDSQANLYLKTGAGIAYSGHDQYDKEIQPAAFAGIAADWEDRRFFVSYENRYLDASDFDDFYSQSARVGVAPYIGDYGDLHTWLMLQLDHKPEAEDKVTVTPMVRLFKDVHLVEAGISNQGEFLFNWIIRY